MKGAPKLSATKNYDLFKLSKFNRDIKKISRLITSMRKHGFIPVYALHVVRGADDKLEVKAGHHRLTAARELGIAVWYVICDDDATIHELEGCTRPWSMRDYLESYIRLGDKHSEQYRIVGDYVNTTGVTPSCAVTILTGRSDMYEFKSGNLTVTRLKYGQTVAEIINRCKEEGFSHASNTLYVTAICMALAIDGFDSKQFLQRFTVNQAMRDLKTNVDGFLDMIEGIYNKKSAQKFPVKFQAKETARLAKVAKVEKKKTKKPKDE